MKPHPGKFSHDIVTLILMFVAEMSLIASFVYCIVKMV